MESLEQRAKDTTEAAGKCQYPRSLYNTALSHLQEVADLYNDTGHLQELEHLWRDIGGEGGYA